MYSVTFFNLLVERSITSTDSDTVCGTEDEKKRKGGRTRRVVRTWCGELYVSVTRAGWFRKWVQIVATVQSRRTVPSPPSTIILCHARRCRGRRCDPARRYATVEIAAKKEGSRVVWSLRRAVQRILRTSQLPSPGLPSDTPQPRIIYALVCRHDSYFLLELLPPRSSPKKSRSIDEQRARYTRHARLVTSPHSSPS